MEIGRRRDRSTTTRWPARQGTRQAPAHGVCTAYPQGGPPEPVRFRRPPTGRAAVGVDILTFSGVGMAAGTAAPLTVRSA